MLWQTSGIGSFQKYTPNKIILDTLSYRRFIISSRDSQRILTTEKIDRQLAGQSSSAPFMSIKDGYSSKRVTFDMQDNLDDKIDMLTLMLSKFTVQHDNLNKQFKPKIYQGKWRGQSRNFYD